MPNTTAVSPAPPKVPDPRLSGFCSGGRHELCAGAVAGASPRIVKQKVDGREREVRLDTTTVACSCVCHDGQPPQCLRCRYRNIDHPGQVDAVQRRCLDVEGCLDRCAQRQANNPTHLLLVEVIRDAETTRAGIRAQRKRGDMTEQPQTEQAPRTPRVKVGACHHCGAPTKGGKFAPGHDAILKGELQKMAENTEARKSDRVMAGAEIMARGWDARKGVPDDVSNEASDLMNKHGVDKIIASTADKRKDRHTQAAG